VELGIIRSPDFTWSLLIVGAEDMRRGLGTSKS
jgi:hypothetical protein